MASFGDKLRRERESRGTSLEEIADASKVHIGFLEALERNEFDTLPGPAFGKLYIRTYAEILGFDPQPLLDAYDRERTRMPHLPSVLLRDAAQEPGREKPGQAEVSRPTDREGERVEPAAGPTPSRETSESREDEPVESPVIGFEERLPEVETSEQKPMARTSSRFTAIAVALVSVVLLAIAAWVHPAFFQRGGGEDRPGTAAEPRPSLSPGVLPSRPVPVPVPEPEEASAAETADGAPEERVDDRSEATDADPIPAGDAGAPREEDPATETAAAPRAARGLSVTEFGVGRGVVDRRLEGRADRFEEGAVAWFWTRVVGGERGGHIRHVWIRAGTPVSSIRLGVGGRHWRTHSRKTLTGAGPWAVEARDPEGRVLAREEFVCVPAGS